MKKVGITVAAAVCVVLLCVGFYFMKNSDGSQASKENLTVVQRINEKNLTDDYPKTPRAVIKLYNQIITSYYSGNYTDDEFDKLIDQARMLLIRILPITIPRMITRSRWRQALRITRTVPLRSVRPMYVTAMM